MTQTTPEHRQEWKRQADDANWLLMDCPEVNGVQPRCPVEEKYRSLIEQLRSAVTAILADLDAAEAEIERLKEESVELHEMILLAEGFHIRDGEMAGWIDSCCMTDAVLSGERLVELGIYERHPNRAGRRSFYRRKDAPARTALENNP